MSKTSKRLKECRKLVERTKFYPLKEAISILKTAPHVKFDETVELSLKLEIDPKQSDQLVRGTVMLPHGTGKKVRIAVFCKGEVANSARQQGADFVGATELIEKISSGWLEFDVAIATPEMMKELARLGKILGPRGLMPSPKSGTVTNHVAQAIKEIKGGKVEFKTDKQADIHVPIGKISFDEGALYENASSLIGAVLSSKPPSVKGQYIKGVSISSTMGPGIKVSIS